MKELEDGRRLDERHETCLNPMLAGLAIVRNSTMVANVNVDVIRWKC